MEIKICDLQIQKIEPEISFGRQALAEQDLPLSLSAEEQALPNLRA